LPKARITGGKLVFYTIARRPGRVGAYITAAWAAKSGRDPRRGLPRSAHRAKALTGQPGRKARRLEGVTRARPEDRAVRATDQAGPSDSRVNTGSRYLGSGEPNPAPNRAGTRLPGRATVTPAAADNGQLDQ